MLRYGNKSVEQFFRTKATRLAAAPGQLAPVFNHSGELIGKALIVVDVAGTAYAEYYDVQRFAHGEIGGVYLSYKSTLRASQLSLAYYAAATPEPSTKVIAGVAAGLLVVIDLASDPIYEAVYRSRQDAAFQLLMTIDREERYFAARTNLLHEIKLLGANVHGR